jgi:hypothetical protein
LLNQKPYEISAVEEKSGTLKSSVLTNGKKAPVSSELTTNGEQKPSKHGKSSNHHHLYSKSKASKLPAAAAPKVDEQKSQKDMSRSFSLNDLIETETGGATSSGGDANEKTLVLSIPSRPNLIKTKTVNKSSPILNEQAKPPNLLQDEMTTTTTATSSLFYSLNHYSEDSRKNFFSHLIQTKVGAAPPPPPPAPPLPQSFAFASVPPAPPPATSTAAAAVDSSSSDLMTQNIIQQYKQKQAPKQRLEIDILPSHLNSSKNKLLIASSFGKIRVVDLFSYKIQKDELKNLLINGICMPKRAASYEHENEILYAMTNGEMIEKEDMLNVSNSVIIVTRRELKVLKKEESNQNEDYVFVNPSGVCYDAFENLYICDSGCNRVKVLDRNLVLLSVIECASSENDRLSQPKSVTSHENTLFVCDSNNHRICAYTILDEG